MQTLLGRLIGGYMDFCERTTRWQEHGREHIAPYWNKGRPIIMAFWHGRIMQAQHGWPRGEAAPRWPRVLISKSKEGTVIALAAEVMHWTSIRGSTAKAGKDKGAVKALKEMVRSLEDGHPIAITPDGPKGPRMRAAMGVVQVARLSGAPIVPTMWSTCWRIQFKSWDRFTVPLPFGRGHFLWSAPIYVPRDASPEQMEHYRLTLETELLRMTAEADRLAGVAGVDPDPVEAAAAPPPEAASTPASAA